MVAPTPVNAATRAIQVFRENGGIMRMANILRSGITRNTLYAMRDSGRPLQELMQYFVMERFLFRLSKSNHAERFVLKGALMFRVWGAPQSRATRDIDLLARAENSVQIISAMMKDVCQQSVEPDGISASP